MPTHLSLTTDLRQAARALRRSPGFAAVAVLTLALGIAAVTAAFSVLDAIVLRGLPYRDAGRLAAVFEVSDDGNFRLPSYPAFLDWRAQSPSAAAVIDGFAFVRGNGVVVGDGPEPDRRVAAYVSPEFFPLLGTRPALGRLFATDEETAGASPVAVISWQLFHERFAGERSAIGATLLVDGTPTTVIGVMPHAFAVPNFASGGTFLVPAVWQPLAPYVAANPQMNRRNLHVDSRTIVRLRAGADSAAVATAMRTIQQRIAAEYPVEQARWTAVALQPIAQQVFGNLRQLLILVSAAVGLVLLLACANIANLFLVRGSVRSREFAVRTALGAARRNLIVQLMAEAALLAGAAGALGTLLGAALVGYVRRAATEQVPFARELALDLRAAAFAVSVSLLTAVLIGALPGLRATAGDLMQRLRGGARGGGDRRDRLVRHGIVSVQFALAVALVLSAGLLLQSFRRLASVPLGYDADGLMSFAIRPPLPAYRQPADAAALYARVMSEVANIPGVTDVAAAGGALLLTPVETGGERGDVTLQARYHPVSAEYLRTMRIPLVAGRWFGPEDMRVATGFVINERLARRLAPDGNAIGLRITVRRSSQDRADFGQPISLPVVGVVGDVRQFGLAQDPDPEVFLPYTLEVWPWMRFVARATDPYAALAATERALRHVEPNAEIMGRPTAIQSGAAAVGAQRRFLTLVLSGFAAAALGLACVGLYSIVAYGVTQRTREIGVRIALGASARNVAMLVLREGAAFVVGGLVLGVAGAYAGARVIRGLLFQTTMTDPWTLVAVSVVLATVTVLAALGPARRAAGTDPMVAMRVE